MPIRCLIFYLAISTCWLPSRAFAAAGDPTDAATLGARLDSDYQQLLAADKHPQPIRDAAVFLASTNQNSHWTDYSKAVALIRQHRSKSSIPLLMKYMLLHASFGSSHIIIPAYVDTISMLAGEKIDIDMPEGKDRQAAMDAAVLDLYLKWWKREKPVLLVDLSQMSDDQIKFIADSLLDHARTPVKPTGHNRQTTVQTQFEQFISSEQSTSGQKDWYPEELHKRMLPTILDSAGYVSQPKDNPNEGDTPVSFAPVPLLAELRHRGEAPSLDKIARDPRQNNITRLTCMLALQASGDRLHPEQILGIYSTDSRIDCRALSLLMLGLCDKNAAVTQKVVAALDDDNAEVRLAALHSLRMLDPNAAIPKLTQVLQKGDPPEMIVPGLEILGKVGGNTSSAVLVEFMQRVLAAGPSEQRELGRALSSLSQTTGKQWVEAGAHKPDYYQAQARAAIAWWKSTHP